MFDVREDPFKNQNSGQTTKVWVTPPPLELSGLKPLFYNLLLSLENGQQ